MSKAPVVRRDVAALLLDVKPAMLDALKLTTWKSGRATLYDPEQINALIELRRHWTKHFAD